MWNILLCSSNQILLKSIYGLLRDFGHEVEITEHPAFAVQLVMRKHYDVLLVDSEPFGLSAEDAVQIIKTLAPELPVLFIGEGPQGQREKQAFDLEEIMKTIQSIGVG